jgi:glycine/D-amino acid oxidase-like deaminating enzyme
LRDHFKLLRVEECNERVRVPNVQGGLYTHEGASLYPGRLVQGLAAVVERRGGAIYENTDVTEVRSGSDARLITPTGELRAKRASLLAGEAYLTRLRQYHRSLLPMYSLISLTEPLKEEQWRAIGWQSYESLTSNRFTVD